MNTGDFFAVVVNGRGGGGGESGDNKREGKGVIDLLP